MQLAQIMTLSSLFLKTKPSDEKLSNKVRLNIPQMHT